MRQALALLLASSPIADAELVSAQNVVTSRPAYRQPHYVAFVLDDDARSVAAVDMISGELVGAVTVEGSEAARYRSLECNPKRSLYRDPTGSRLVLVHEPSWCRGAKVADLPRWRSAVTVIDATTLTVIARIELDQEIYSWHEAMQLEASDEIRRMVSLKGGVGIRSPSNDSLFSGDGLLLTLPCYRYAPDDELHQNELIELVTIDLTLGRVKGSVNVGFASQVFGSQDGKTAFALLKRTEAESAELKVVDLQHSALVGSVPLDVRFEGEPTSALLSADQQFVYVLEDGNPPPFIHETDDSVLVNVTSTEFGRIHRKFGSAVRGPAVTQIDFATIGGATRTESVNSLVDVRPGDRFNADELQRSVEQMYALGVFEDIHVQADKVEKGISLSIRLHPGSPNGRIHVISPETLRVVKMVEVCSGWLEVAQWGMRVLVLSRGLGTGVEKPKDRLTVLEGTQATHVELSLTPWAEVLSGHGYFGGREPSFFRLSPDGRQIFHVGERTITAIDGKTLHPTTAVELESGSVMTRPFAATADGTRGLALDEREDRLTVLDFEAGKVVATLTTGRKGTKVASFIADVMLSGLAGTPVTSRGGGLGNGSVAVRPDGQYAYAVNLRSNDVNVVDLRTGSISKKIPGAGGLLMLSGNILAVLSPSRIHLIDTSSNRKISELVIDGPRNLVWTPEEEYAVVLCPKTLSCIETRTGREISRFEDFKAASDFVIARRPEGNQ